MRILLTNDDGIDAPGLAVLADLCREWGDVVVVAPDQERSGCGHATTTSRPLRVADRGPGRFAVDGTPADCVRLGLTRLAGEVDWVVSGINRGGNLGVDIHLSGTVAAAREAALAGRPALALSQLVRSGRPLSLEAMGLRARLVLEQAMGTHPGSLAFWNANLPHPQADEAGVPIVVCPPDPSPLDVRFEPDADGFRFAGSYHGRARREGHDIAVCFGGSISLSRIPCGWPTF